MSSKHFIRKIVSESAGNGQAICTRFPPEPNGYLHIGHAKSICLNFEMAHEHQGQCILRFDDTNPEGESAEYSSAIQRDVEWLGYTPDKVEHASDYYEQLYRFAVQMIENGKAYACELSLEQMREMRGDYKRPGVDSPSRDRPVEESLTLFEQMRQGKYADGQYCLRAKIDMQSGNMYMRDPVLYRIRHVQHYRTNGDWCLYPTYDFAQCLCDALDGVTHSLCTLEFEEHRPLYDFILQSVELSNPVPPRQIEFSRLQLDYSITSKRKLRQLVETGAVNGWDDPRLHTLAGLKRRGYPAEAIRDFCTRVGVTRQQAWSNLSLLENSVRNALESCDRAMAVLRPVRVVLTNLEPGTEQSISAPLHPKEPERGTRELILEQEICIEADDFAIDPLKGYFRLRPGGEVRLRYAGVIRCDEYELDADGQVSCLRCTYLGEVEHKVKGVIHWVPASSAITAQVRLYDRLFRVPQPDEVEFSDALNPESLLVIEQALLEPSLSNWQGQSVQFERLGYFCPDLDSTDKLPVLNRVVTLRDTWQDATDKGQG